MKKIILDVDALKVTSFSPDPEPDATRGTVEAYATPGCGTPGCGTTTCATRLYGTGPCDTCQQASCVDTCTAPYQVQC